MLKITGEPLSAGGRVSGFPGRLRRPGLLGFPGLFGLSGLLGFLGLMCLLMISLGGDIGFPAEALAQTAAQGQYQDPDTEITLTKTVEVYSYEDLTFTIENYTVTEGDNLEGILKKEGLWPLIRSNSRETQLLKLVGELNPAIANLNQISPGQNIYLPIARVEQKESVNPQNPYEAIVSYSLGQPNQSPAVVTVRSQTAPKPPAEVLPEGTWALNLDGVGSGADPKTPPGASPQYDQASYVPPPVPFETRPSKSSDPNSASAPPNSTQRGSPARGGGAYGNDGPIETAPDGTSFRTVRVRNGDTLEKLLRREGVDPKLIYRHYIKLTVSLNPDIKNPNLILAGAQLRIPTSGGGGYSNDYYYDNDNRTDLLYADAAGKNTVSDATPVSTASRRGGQTAAKASPKAGAQGAPAPAAKYRTDVKRLPPAPLPTADSQNGRTVLGIIFTRLGEKVITSGRKFLDLSEPPHFDVETANMPIVELRNGRFIILDLQRTLSEEFIKRFRQKYQEYYVFQPVRGEPMDKALERLWPMCGYYRVYAKGKVFEGGRDVKLSISADWLVWPSSSDWNKGQPYVINLAPSQDNGTPLPWIEFLKDHNIQVIDLYGGQLLAGSTKGATPVNNFTVIDVESDNPSAFAEALIKSFGFSPRVGVKVDLTEGKIQTGGEIISGSNTPAIFWEAGPVKTILEYGELSTEDVKALRSNGFKIISSGKESETVLKSILSELNIKLGGPLVLNGDSTGGPSIKLVIAGQTFQFNDRTYLFTTVNLPSNMTSLDPNQNVVVLKYKDLRPTRIQTPAPPTTSAPPIVQYPSTTSSAGESNPQAPPNITSEDI
jgi:hypothetical protein